MSNKDKEPSRPLRIPDPKDFDPKADASDWPITDITAPGRAVQIIGGVRPANPYDRYSVTRARQLLDSAPLKHDKPPLVFDKATGAWVTFTGLVGEQSDSIPVTAEEAARFCKDGTLPENVMRRLES
jgi:hypothetical protein